LDLEWNDEQIELRRVARAFAEREIAPYVAQYDREERFPAEIVKRAAKLGFAGGIVPNEYGGSGLDYLAYTGIIEEISRTCHIVACALTFPSGLVGHSILRYGTEEQKQRYLVPLANGDAFGGAGVTEARSGTDVSDMDTTARRNGGDYVISGAKMWISFLDVASFFLTFAHLGVDEGTGRKRICAFIVDADLPGVSLNPLKNKFGFRPLSTGELVLNEVRVPKAALVGEEGQGFEIAMNAVENGRLGVRRLRTRAPSVPHADRDVPDGAGDAERHDLRDRGGPSAHIPPRPPEEQGRTGARCGIDGEDDGFGCRAPSRDQRLSDTRRLRGLRRVPGRPLSARREGVSDRGGE
jgi:alkylation response protein AidB-like acyl-CoA dehydrogenase